MPEIVNGIPVPSDGDPVDLPGDLQAMAAAVGDVAESAGAAAGAAAATGYASSLDDTKMKTVAQNPASEFAGVLTASIGQVANVPMTTTAQRWSTTVNGVEALTQSTPPPFDAIPAVGSRPIYVDTRQQYQTMLGFGAALTDSSAYLLWTKLTAAQRHDLLTELFHPDHNGWTQLRIGIGSTDFTSVPYYTYDDQPTGVTDPALAGFSVQKDAAYIIPIIREILAINPGVRIMASPWSPPAWMKTGATPSLIGGTFNSAYYAAYAQYFVKFLQAYRDYGIPIWAVTMQNEVTYGTAPYPCLAWTATQQATFIGTHLGPAIEAAGFSTKIIAWDNGWGEFPTIDAVVGDATAGPFIEGVGWHGYGGDPHVQLQVARKYPTKSQHFTEMRTLLSEDWAASLKIMAGDLAVASLRFGSRTLTLWNLALDEAGNPTVSPGRRGVVTIPSDGSGNIARSAEYYVLTHLARDMQPGARRIESTTYAIGRDGTDVQTIAFANPDGSVILFCYNPAGTDKAVQIIDSATGQGFPATIRAGEICHFMWGTAALTIPAGVPAVLTTPTAPTLSGTAGKQAATLTIGAPSAAGSAPIATYKIYRKVDAGAFLLRAEIPASQTTFKDTGLSFGTAYAYKVSAVSAAGEGAQSSSVSVGPLAPTVPDAPTITLMPGDNKVTVTWATPDNGGADITGYTIRRGTTSGSLTTLTTVAGTVGSYVDTTAANGTTYYYTVSATNSVGAGAQSAEASVVPKAPVTVGTVSAAKVATNALTNTFSHAVAAGTTMLVVAVSYDTSSPGATQPTGVTYGGTAMTLVPGSRQTSTTGTAQTFHRATELWYLNAPSVGTANVVVTFTGTSVSQSATAVNLTGTGGTFGTIVTEKNQATTSLSADVAAPSGSVILVTSAARTSTNIVPGPALTQLSAQIAGSNAAQAVAYAAGGATVTASVSWTSSDNGVMVAVPILTA